MKPVAFDYLAPTDLDGALAALANDGARLLAGGQSLVPLLNLRLARPSLLVDLGHVPDLDGIVLEGGVLRVGAMVRQRRLERDPRLVASCPLLAAALPWIGHPQTRNRGTVGGSLCHADPSAELPVAAVALGAECVLQGAAGRRVVAAADFFVGYLTADVRAGEVLVEVRFPVEASPSCFLEVSRRNGDFALVAVAVRREPAVIVVGGAMGVPARLTAAEQALRSGERADAVGRIAAGEVDPDSDLHASADYRRQVTAALVERAVERVRAA